VQRRRAATASQQRKAALAWRDDGSVRVIADAMSASISHGSKVRSGLLVPHKRHWAALGLIVKDARPQKC